MGIIKDIWEVTEKISIIVKEHSERASEAKKARAAFCNEFLDHPDDVTHVENYFTFHGDSNSWLEGSGLLRSVTHKEISILWADTDLFVPYEAEMVRFLENGGSISRCFVLSQKGIAHDWYRMYVEILFRHQMLGLNPRVISLLDAENIEKKLGISCLTFAQLNDNESLFFRLMDDKSAFVARSFDKQILARTNNALNLAYENSEPFLDWYKRESFSLNKKELAEIDRQVDFIKEIARFRKK